ncbi:MAG: hypothetical protein ABR975_11485, partial [Vulcanimicrobiaceae bacterium]
MDEPTIDRRSVIALHGWQSRLIQLLRAVSTSPAVDTVLQRIRNRGQVRAGTGDQLAPFDLRIGSQNGEGGILKELFFRLGQGDRFFVEFGVGDGSECNTAALAGTYHWHGLYIEGASSLYEGLRQRYAVREDVRCVQAMITAENIAGLFAAAGVPTTFDLLSIDVDGNDWWLWRALRAYRPRVVVVEYNAAYVPPVRWIMQYDPA